MEFLRGIPSSGNEFSYIIVIFTVAIFTYAMYVRVSVILHANFSFYGWKAIAPYTLYSMGNSSLVIFKTIDLKGGLDNSQSQQPIT